MHDSLTDFIDENLEVYKKHAATYDDVSLSLGYTLPSKMVEFSLKYLPCSSEQASILDLGAGTGLIAKYLRSHGYKGAIDGIDALEAMLEASAVRHEYRNFLIHLINEELPYSDNVYDAIICCGALGNGHIPGNSVKDIMRILKPGGYFVFELENWDEDQEDMEEIKNLMKELEDERKCKLIEKKTLNSVYEETYGANSAELRCYKKFIY